jgi:hypothetical protein
MFCRHALDDELTAKTPSMTLGLADDFKGIPSDRQQGRPSLQQVFGSQLDWQRR